MELAATRREIERLEQNGRPASEIEFMLLDDLSQETKRKADVRFPERDDQLEGLYQKALAALEQGKQERARKLLLKVVALEPNYKDATHYLHLAITGVKIKPQPDKQGDQEQTNRIVNKMKPLFVWNPLHHLRLLWWLLVTPHYLYIYEQAFGRKSLHYVSKWLASTLIWLPLFIPTFAFSLSVLPSSSGTSPNYLLLNSGLLMAWLLTGWLGDREDNLAVMLSVLAAGIVASSTMFGVTGNLMSAVAGSVALGIALGMALRLSLAIAFSVAGSVASGVALGMVGGVVIGAISNVALGTARSIASGMTIGVALIIILILAGSAARGINEESNRTTILGGFIFSLLLLTYAFLIWYSLLGGWQMFM